MVGGAVYAVPVFGGLCFYPLHDPGQVCAVCRGDKQVDVGWHYTEIVYFKIVFFFGGL